MKINIIRIMFITIFSLVIGAVSASADDPVNPDKMEREREGTNPAGDPLQMALEGIRIAGGISAGYFYASNPGEDTSEDAFLLSNFLVEISSSDEDLPIGFVAAFGETSTPSLLDTPENNTDLDIEYASLTLTPVNNLSLEAGLLQPNAGFENTYTYANENIILGAVASQQPYNAYGARAAYDVNGLSFWGGYFKERLDDEEYNSPDSAWEIGLSGSILENCFSFYHYNIKDQRNLTGAVIERTIDNMDIAFVIDYWRWNSAMKNFFGSSSAIGGAFYISPCFGRLSVPMRFEYIDQKKSQIYIENPDTEDIYTVTVSPTWHFNENAYIRAEAAYVKADGAFADEDGSIKDDRINMAIEAGFTF